MMAKTVLMKNASVVYVKPFGDLVSIEIIMNSFAAESQRSYLLTLEFRTKQKYI